MTCRTNADLTFIVENNQIIIRYEGIFPKLERYQSRNSINVATIYGDYPECHRKKKKNFSESEKYDLVI